MRAGSFLVLAVLVATPVRAEMVEEIIAWVNGDIITKSQYEEELNANLAEMAERLTGPELEQMQQAAKDNLLLTMIDRRIMLHHAEALGYNLEEMGDSFAEGFLKQQGIESFEEFERLAGDSDVTLAELKERLINRYGPDEVIRFEITKRVSISNAEVETYYRENAAQFAVTGSVVLREIVLLAGDTAAKEARRAEAQALHARARGGEEFASLAREHSESGTRDLGGKFGPLKRSDLAEVLAAPAFTLPVGGISDLMENPYGFHIIKVDSRVEDHVQPMDEVSDTIRELLSEEKFRADLDAFLEKARAESEWCIKPKHKDLLSIEAPKDCERL